MQQKAAVVLHSPQLPLEAQEPSQRQADSPIACDVHDRACGLPARRTQHRRQHCYHAVTCTQAQSRSRGADSMSSTLAGPGVCQGSGCSLDMTLAVTNNMSTSQHLVISSPAVSQHVSLTAAWNLHLQQSPATSQHLTATKQQSPVIIPEWLAKNPLCILFQM